MKIGIKIPVILFFISFFTLWSISCGVVRQAKQMSNLVNCDFRVLNVQNIYLAGVSIQNIQDIKNLGFTDAARIMTAVAGKSLPLKFLLNLEGKNPNSDAAGMNLLDWILFIDNIQMASGRVTESFVIPPNNGTTTIPIQVSLDLKQILKGKSLEAIANFAFNLSGAGNRPTRITVKVKPTIMIGQSPLKYPGYITINTDFSGLQ